MSKKHLITVWLCIAFCLSVTAQTITGEVVDAQQQPLAYTNIVMQTTDSAFVAGTVTNEKGNFKLEKVPAGDYRLVISNIGYRTLYIDLQGLSRTTNMGRLTLEEMSAQLDEVTVTASSRVSRADRKMVFPNKQQVNASSNGVDLLRTLMLPRLRINTLDGNISMSDGGTVQLCINGRKATKEEVTALLPDEIIRVDFQEDPGLRYADAGAVINYIVRRYDMGGSIGYNGRQSIKSGFGRHNVTGKVNFNKSEISFYYGNNLQFFKELWYDKKETFTFDNASQYHRNQHAESNGKKNVQQWGAITYNLQDNDKYMLNITAGFSHYNDPALRMKGELYTEEFPTSITSRDEWKHKRNLSPNLDIYFQRNLKHKQFLALNVVGTYINTKNRSSYVELLNESPVVDYYSGVRGKKYSLIAEGIYEKGFKNGGRLSTGVRHTQGYADNDYKGTLQYNSQMKQADTYAYAQYSGKWKKLGYRFGLGITRSWFQQIGQEDYETYSLNPRLNLNYTFNDQWSASLNGNVSTINPSLSELSAVEQLTDSLQSQRGNPNLKPYSYYRNTLRLNYSKGIWDIGMRGQYYYRDNVIMEEILCENNKFVHSFANHPNYSNLTFGLDARVGMLWNVLQLSGSIESVSTRSHGRDYRHTRNSIGWDAGATFMYKNFTATIEYSHNSDYFFGEDLSTGEEAHMIQLQYRWKRLKMGVIMFNPFQKDYKREEANWNKYAGYSYHYHIDDIARMICVTLSWNMNFGRDYKSSNKKIKNIDTDAGVL